MIFREKNHSSSTDENEKEAKTVFYPWMKAKNEENCSSSTDESKKKLKIILRSCLFIKNCQKQHFACERRAKNDENSPSLVVFHRKLPKIAFRLQATGGK